MINIKLHKNELQLIKESIESSKWFGNEPKLCDRVLKKLDKALTIPVVVGQSEQLRSSCDWCNGNNSPHTDNDYGISDLG